MRKVNYTVRQADGSKFNTTDYSKATTDGNRIVETFLTEVDETTEEQQARAKAHAQKIRERLERTGSLLNKRGF